MYTSTKNLFGKLIVILAGLLSMLSERSIALELSDIHIPMTRDEADDTLSKDYKYAVLADGSVRRTWELDGKKVFIDFDTVTNKAIMVAVVYDRPVAKKKGIEDAHTLAHGKYDANASWNAPKDREAKELVQNVYGLKNARRKKLEDKAVLFYEADDKNSNRIVRVSLFANMPHTHRWALTTITKNSSQTAMGNQMGASFIANMYKDEQRRQESTPAPAKPQTASSDTADSVPSFTISVTSNKTASPSAKEEDATPDVTETAPVKPAKHTATAAQKPVQKPVQKPKNPNPEKTTASSAATATAAATPQPVSMTATNAKEPSKEGQLEPGRHTMSLLPAPPTWLSAIGIEEPTWWHYIGIGVIALLILVYIIRALSQSAGKAAQRKRFANVVAQGAATQGAKVKKRP